MGEKDESKLFIDCGNGEYEELTEIKEVELGETEKSSESIQKLSEAFEGLSFSVDIASEGIRKLSETLYLLYRLQCNNYRKLHGLSMRRKYRK